MMKAKVIDYSARLNLFAPPSLTAAVSDAAAKNMTTVSSYIRMALLAKLRADGCEPKEAA
jgi:hypothetical protein